MRGGVGGGEGGGEGTDDDGVVRIVRCAVCCATVPA